MERYASTFAVTAAFAALLLTAHHHIASQRETVPMKPVAAKSVAVPPAQSWVEPPPKAITVAATPIVSPEHVADAAPAPEPAIAEAPVAALAAAMTTQHTALRPEQTKRAEQKARARKLAQARERRTRMAARAVPAETTANPGQAGGQPAAAEKRIDPIGDILRGLGIGGEG